MYVQVDNPISMIVSAKNYQNKLDILYLCYYIMNDKSDMVLSTKLYYIYNNMLRNHYAKILDLFKVDWTERLTPVLYGKMSNVFGGMF